jgi:hypothetical protein
MIKTCASAVLFLILSSSAVFAQEEPWGGNVPGWKFTQTAESDGVANCRAMQGPNIISRRNNGRTYVSVPAPAGLAKGWYREGTATIIIGGSAEPIDAAVDGRLVFYIDEGNYPALIRSRGYQWQVSGPGGLLKGTVSYSGDIAKVFSEIRACANANSTASNAQPAASRNPKWSGDWTWIRPMIIFGKPVDTRGQRLSIELLQNKRVNICVDLRRNDTCSNNVPFNERNGVYTLSVHGSELYEIRAVNDELRGQFWWDKANRTKSGPDGTFLLKR